MNATPSMTGDGEEPLLSLCMPTYNRSNLLERHLRELDQPGLLPFPFEVVVSDNCSTDETLSVLQGFQPRFYRLRSFRNPSNLGALANQMGVLRRAEGRYCLYLGDDDRIDPPKLARAIERMTATPDSVAYYTGWTCQNLATDAVLGTVGTLPDEIYTLDRAADLIDAILRNYLFPEIAIYRVSALVRVLFPSPIFFWHFPVLDRLLQLGSVLTTSEPFYQLIGRHPGESETRDSTGRGLEYRVWAGFLDGINLLIAKYRPKEQLRTDIDAEAAYRAYIGNQSFFSSLHRKRYAEAFEIGVQLAAQGTLMHHHGAADWMNFSIHVAIENAQRAFEIMGGVEKIVCVGFDRATFIEIESIFEHTAGAHRLPVSAADMISLPPHSERYAVLTASNALRQVLLARGHPIGQVLSLEDLREVFRLGRDA